MGEYYKMYALAECPYCVKAQELFLKEGIMHEIVMLNDDEELRLTKEQYTHPTVPIILEIDNEGEETLIGGHSDLLLHLGVDSD